MGRREGSWRVGGGGGRREGEEGRAGFFSSSFILQKGCNQHSGERWHRVSPKTAQWPRRRGQATDQAGTRVGQGPHCPAGHCWRLQRPLTSPAFTHSFPTLAFFSPCGPPPSSLSLAFLRMASSRLSAWRIPRHQPGIGKPPTSARQRLLTSPGSTSPSILNARHPATGPALSLVSLEAAHPLPRKEWALE